MGAQPQWTARIERSRRKTIGIRITDEGEVVVRAPLHTPVSEIRRVLDKKRSWIEKTLEKVRVQEQAPKLTNAERNELARLAKAVIPPRVAAWAKRAGISYGRITLRLQKTRWGSCSARGNLNFNCLLMLCPEPFATFLGGSGTGAAGLQGVPEVAENRGTETDCPREVRAVGYCDADRFMVEFCIQKRQQRRNKR